MHIGKVPCPQCQQDESDPSYWIDGGELRDDLAFNTKCPNNHVCVIILQCQKFEILFDMGCSALLDGYGREAVSSFAAAQERFHEFCIKVFAAKHSVPKSEFDKTWKTVASQSERQIGAYYFMYLILFQSAPPQIPAWSVEFRNKVIHKGHIPSTGEATKYANYIFDYCITTINHMQASLADEISQVCQSDIDDLLTSISGATLKRTVPWDSIISLGAPAELFGVRDFTSSLSVRQAEHRLELEQRLKLLNSEIIPTL